jgi:phage terminase large subunit-like protein
VGVSLPLEKFVQGYKSFSPAISAFEVAAVKGQLRHGGHPVLRWCVANVMVTHAPGVQEEKNRRPEKRRHNGRIDLAVAALMAVGSLKVTAAPAVETAALIA